jgi:predicted RNase H-like HicB family nuclease
MKLLLAIHKDKASTYGVTIPDVPGCYSWGDTINDAIRNAGDAVIVTSKRWLPKAEEWAN